MQVFRADPVEPVGGQHLRSVVQFRSQFDAGGAGADDGDTHCVVVRVVPGMRTQVLAEQLAMEAFGLGAGIEENAVFRSALGAEVVGGAADGDHQGVVGDVALGNQFNAILVHQCGQADPLAGAIQALHAAELEFEVVPLRLGDVVQLVLGGVERAGGDFVQQGFPDVGEVGVDQGDLGLAAFTQGAAETGGELQPAGAAADDHDAMGHVDIS